MKRQVSKRRYKRIMRTTQEVLRANGMRARKRDLRKWLARHVEVK